MAAVAEASRDNARRRGKIFCREMAFFRGNLVRRVLRRSPQFLAPSSECKRRVPTSEECPRSCPVHPASWPDNRGFLVPEMEVVDLANTHFGTVCISPSAIAVPGNFRCCTRRRTMCLRRLARVSISPLKIDSSEKVSVGGPTANRH